MEYRHEIIHFGNHIPVKFFLHKIGDVSKHWHQSLELIIVLKGDVSVTIGDTKYNLTNDDLILINSNSVHELHSDGAVMIALQIKLSILENFSINTNKLYFKCNSAVEKDASRFKNIKNIIARIIKCNMNSNEWIDVMNISLVYALIYDLCTNFSIEKSTDTEVTPFYNVDRLSRILDYINKNYTDPIKLCDIAEAEYLSLPYLSKFFNHYMGISFTEYLKNIRLQHAVIDLYNENNTIEAISSSNGFPNTRAFTSAFKEKYGQIPSVWRKNLDSLTFESIEQTKEKSINYYETDASLLQIDLSNFINSNINKDITIPHTPKKPILSDAVDINVNDSIRHLTHNFKNFIGFSRAKELLFSENQEIIKKMQHEIGFKYVKLHGLLSDDMMVYGEKSDGTPVFSFRYLDMVLDFLMENNLMPLFQLSFMPRLLAKNPDKTVFYTPFITSEPNDIKKWNNLVSEVIKHVLSRYGSSLVHKWLFCVWNEPSSSNALFGFPTDEIFYNLYENTYKTVKEIDPALQFGGPTAFSTYGKSEDWLFDFLSFTSRHDCTPDFINVHYYDIDLSYVKSSEKSPDHNKSDMFSNSLYLSPVEDSFKQFITRLKSRLFKNGFQDKPIFLTEWNSTVSHKDLLNDTCFKSAYVTKNILENYDDLASFGYWLANDMNEEFRVTQRLFHGGLGMFTVNNIPKPVYYSFYLMNKLGDTLIAHGNGYFITKTSDNYQIMLYNYHHYSDAYSKELSVDTSYNSRYENFPTKAPRTFSFNLLGLNGNYLLTHYIVNQDYGSSYDNYVKMGGIEPETTEEIEYLKNISVPRIIKEQKSGDNILPLKVTLAPFEIRLIEIVRLK